jgi:hypothetical protein
MLNGKDNRIMLTADDDDMTEREYEVFHDALIAQLMPRTREIKDRLQHSMVRPSVDLLLRWQEEGFAGLTLLWAATPEKFRERLLDKIGPGLARWAQLAEENRQLAINELARRIAANGQH